MKLPFVNTNSIYLQDNALRNLRHYKYSSIDKSYLSKYVLQPYWTFVAKYFPIWMAPNLITLCGFLCVMFNVALILNFTPDLAVSAPRWVYISFSLGIWMYSTLDNVDGKQARRTGTSSPLGELFDHGCDALCCVFGALVQAAALIMGTTWYTVSIMFLTMIPFFASTWEHYHTGSLYLGYVNGPTEGITIACILMLLSGILGPSYIWTELSSILGNGMAFLPGFMQDYSLADFMLFIMFVLLIFTQLPMSFYSVYKATRSSPSENSFSEALGQWSPFLLLSLSVYVWLRCPTSIALSHNALAFFTLVAFAFGEIATSVILAHLVKGRFPMFTPLILPVFVGSILFNCSFFFSRKIDEPFFDPSLESYYIYASLAVSLLVYFNFIFNIIERFCTFLNIKCLTIPTHAPISTTEPQTDSTSFFINESANSLSPEEGQFSQNQTPESKLS